MEGDLERGLGCPELVAPTLRVRHHPEQVRGVEDGERPVSAAVRQADVAVSHHAAVAKVAIPLTLRREPAMVHLAPVPEDGVVDRVHVSQVPVELERLRVEPAHQRYLARGSGEGRDGKARHDVGAQVARDGPDVGRGDDQTQVTAPGRKRSLEQLAPNAL